MRRLLVTGSRDWADAARIAFNLGHAYGLLHTPGQINDVVLVHGACPRGADKLAADLWASYELPVEAHPADWDSHNKAAGFVRNIEMVSSGADLCLAFIKAESPGATMTAKLARDARIPTVVVRA